MEDIVYICINAYWETETIRLPLLPKYLSWHLAVNTGVPYGEDAFFPEGAVLLASGEFLMKERSVAVFTGRSRQ